MNGLVKICGVTDAAGLNAALAAGADMIGFVFREKSPRFIAPTLAANLAQKAKTRARTAAVVVDADDDFLEMLASVVNPDTFQLHGAETPARAAAIAARFNRPVFKALGIAAREDVGALKPFERLCEMILLETKTPQGLASGGSGRAFDWQLLDALERRDHIILAGGLNAENVAEAIGITKVRAVDVSSGVESAPRCKDKDKMARFIENARHAFAGNPVSSLIS